MPNYLMYRDDLETIAPDEQETKQKIVEVMTQGMELARQKYGRSVRISHAKAHALLKGEPAQTAWDPGKDGYFEDLSFSPAHALAAHRPLGGINRARLLAYTMLAERRLADNGKTVEKPATLAEVPG